MKLSVLIPTTDQVIKLKRLRKELKRRKGVDEVIVSSGGNTRGQNYNAAARAASGDVLVLLHQNTIKLPKNAFTRIKKVMKDPSVVGGGINTKFDHKSNLLRLIAWLSNNYRMRLRKIIYADQTIFVRESVFQKLKGFKRMPIFEDTDFSARLKKQGKLVFLKGPVVTSAHRFVKNGVLFHTLRNQLLKLLYHFSVQPKALKRIYEFRLRGKAT